MHSPLLILGRNLHDSDLPSSPVYNDVEIPADCHCLPVEIQLDNETGIKLLQQFFLIRWSEVV